MDLVVMLNHLWRVASWVTSAPLVRGLRGRTLAPILALGMCLCVSATFPAWGTVCGDGIVDAGEQCDDGNMIDDDVCANDCTLNPCADGDLDGFGSPGSPVCSGGPAEDCNDNNAGVYPGAPEFCDGLDNDCNGLDDVLGFDGSETDDDGDGFAECENDCDDNDPTNFSGNAEVCDGQDNDCDGATDEMFFVGSPCVFPGECGQGVFECDGSGAAQCSTAPGASADGSSPEVCDGLDNDCDGGADEGFDVGSVCDGGGTCGEGVLECAAGGATVCSTAPGGSADASSLEVCDGLDNDCDGSLDEDYDVGAACGLGVCEGGVRECTDDGSATRCSTEAGGSDDQSGPEVCDGLDNDCNGKDDVLGFAGSETDDDGDGFAECEDDCDDADALNYSGNPEVCDGQDNDCDVDVDEGFDVGAACDGTGECGAGIVECDGSGAAVCSSDPGGSGDASTDETCDGLDNDCDGATDEEFGIGEVCIGTGECGEGVFECDPEGGAMCSVDVGGSADASVPEICDGLDNDCDGEVDEDFVLGDACGEGACEGGVVECRSDGAGTQCSTADGGSADAAGDETCDGLDNDCDGEIDEDYGVGESCGVGACAGGVIECNESGSGGRCDTMPGGSNDQSGPEVCDGVDNDCNGLDDALGFAGSEIDDDGDGFAECQDDCDDADAAMFPGNPERCDGLDNDCNGEVDEGDPEVGRICGSSDVGACSFGVGVCRDGVFACVGGVDPLPELCDSLDNDCDGETDEGHPHPALVDEDFGGAGSPFPPWLGTGANNALTGPNRFEVLSIDGDPALATLSTSLNLHAHYVTPQSAGWTDYLYSGRMKLTDPGGGVGVTVLSDFPNSNSYYRLRRYPLEPTFKMSAHGTSLICDTDDTGVDPRDGAWYRFEMAVEVDAVESRVLARVWRDGDVYPADWQVRCHDASATRRLAGTVGAWSMGAGIKAWDDLSARRPEGTDPTCGISDVGECAFGTRECLGGTSVCSGGSFPQPESCDGLDNDCDGAADEADAQPGETLWQSLFLEPGQPEDWFDTGAGNSLNEADHFEVVDVDGDPVLCTTSELVNIHSHYVAPGSAQWSNYVYRGRLRLTDPEGGIGVTVLSDYPNHDHYYRLRRLAGFPFLGLTAHGTSVDCDVEDTGVDPADGAWYHFAIQVEATFGAVQAKVWRHGDPEPESWQQQCTDLSANLRTSGTIGVWSMAAGAKYWDDLRVISNGITPDGGGHCGVTDVGACQFGLEQCEDGQLVCSGQVDPAPEVCDGLDNDCDGEVDEDDALDVATWYPDADADGFGDASQPVTACDAPDGYVADATDCDDTDPAAWPGNPEVCDGIDNDCDPATLEDDAVDAPTWYADEDEDGFGDETHAVQACTAPDGHVPDAGDCDDGSAAVFPGQVELCDGIDNDCSGAADEGLEETGESCTVGEGVCAASGNFVCAGDGPGACDAQPGEPGIEQCDFLDNDCDGQTDEGPSGEDVDSNGCNDACDPLPALVIDGPAILNLQSQGQFVEFPLDLGPVFGAADVDGGTLFELSLGMPPAIPESSRDTDELGRLRVRFPRQALQDVAPLGDVALTLVGRSDFGCAILAETVLQVVDEGRPHVSEDDPSSVLDDAIRGDLVSLRSGADGNLGPVVCLIDFLSDYELINNSHPGNPAEGQAYFYLFHYCAGSETCSYGTTTAGNERLPSSGGCPTAE